MGRKSIDKKRKNAPQKRREWAVQLYPYFRDHGLQDVKMDTMASLLGKSKSTVYEYFSSKEEIIEETLQYKLEMLLGFEEILSDTSISLTDRFIQFMEYMTPVLSDITNLLIDDLKTLFPKIWETVEQFYEYASQVLEKYYDEGMKKGVFKKRHPALLALSDKFFFTELMNPQFLKENNLTPTLAFQEYFEIKFYGLMA